RRNDAGLGHGVGGGEFDFEPRLVSPGLTPDRPHLGVRVPPNHFSHGAPPHAPARSLAGTPTPRSAPSQARRARLVHVSVTIKSSITEGATPASSGCRDRAPRPLRPWRLPRGRRTIRSRPAAHRQR